MQARIGKTRSYGCARWNARSAFTCLLTVILLSSCSLFTTRKNLPDDQTIKGICLTSSGKGRLEHSKGRHLFDYEALFDKPTKKWSIAFDLPVIGEELLALQVIKENPLRMSATGTFATRLKIDVQTKSQKRLLKKFYGAIGRLILLLNSKESLENNKDWEYEMKDGEAFFTYKLANDENFVLKAFDYDGHFNRLKFLLSGKRKLSLDLFVSQCSL